MRSADGTATIKLIVFGAGFLPIFIIAVLFDLPYLYLMALSLAVLPHGSRLLAQWLGPRFQVRRDHPHTAPEGRILPVTLTVSAEGGLPQATLRISDDLPPEIAAADAAGEALPLDHWDGRNGSRTYRVEPTRRGVYRLGPARVVTTDPLGLFIFALPVAATTELVVHPTPIPARDATLGGEGLWGVREREGRTRRGEGMDFHGVREWRHGDPLRRVHWPTTARTGQLAVVEWEQAFQQNLVIGLDLSRGTEHGQGRETTLEYAVKAAATLADRALAAGGGVSLVTQAGRVDVGVAGAAVSRRRGAGADSEAARFRLFDHLARVRADATHSLALSLRAERLVAGGARLAILTAAGDPLLTTHLAERVARGDRVRVFFFEPASFGGPTVMSPAVVGATLRVVRREDSPWQDGGRALEYLLRNDE